MYKVIAQHEYEEVPFTFDSKREAVNLISDFLDNIDGKFVAFKVQEHTEKENPD